jgi:hypothetical protein
VPIIGGTHVTDWFSAPETLKACSFFMRQIGISSSSFLDFQMAPQELTSPLEKEYFNFFNKTTVENKKELLVYNIIKILLAGKNDNKESNKKIISFLNVIKKEHNACFLKISQTVLSIANKTKNRELIYDVIKMLKKQNEQN